MQQTLVFSILSKAKQNISLANRERFGPEMVGPTPPGKPKVGSRSGFFGRFPPSPLLLLCSLDQRVFWVWFLFCCVLCVFAMQTACLVGFVSFLLEVQEENPQKCSPFPIEPPDPTTRPAAPLPCPLVYSTWTWICSVFRCFVVVKWLLGQFVCVKRTGKKDSMDRFVDERVVVSLFCWRQQQQESTCPWRALIKRFLFGVLVLVELFFPFFQVHRSGCWQRVVETIIILFVAALCFRSRYSFALVFSFVFPGRSLCRTQTSRQAVDRFGVFVLHSWFLSIPLTKIHHHERSIKINVVNTFLVFISNDEMEWKLVLFPTLPPPPPPPKKTWSILQLKPILKLQVLHYLLLLLATTCLDAVSILLHYLSKGKPTKKLRYKSKSVI